MQSKAMMIYHYMPTRTAKLKINMTILNTGKDVEKLDVSYLSGGNGKWQDTLENSSAVS